MQNQLIDIYESLGITQHHLSQLKLSTQLQPSLDELRVVDIDFEGRPFILHSKAAEAWRSMQRKAQLEDIFLMPFSGFRSYQHQKNLIDKHLKNGRLIDDILTHIAVPGFSEHHTGKAIDIHASDNPRLEEDFENTKEFNWLNHNAHQFGFQMSYPRDNLFGIIYEPWHWYYNE